MIISLLGGRLASLGDIAPSPLSNRHPPYSEKAQFHYVKQKDFPRDTRQPLLLPDKNPKVDR